MTDKSDDQYENFGVYPNCDAKLILDAFVANNISFDIHIDDSEIKKMSPVRAAYGGTYGQGVGIAISVHVNDINKAMIIQRQALKIE